jgi:hypothetical protein
MATKPKASRAKKADRPKKAAKPKKMTKAEQSERFIETARAVGVDETGSEFERLFKRVARWAGFRKKES